MSTGKLFFAARCELLQFRKIGVLNFIFDHSSGMIVICWPGIVMERMQLTDEAMGGSRWAAWLGVVQAGRPAEGGFLYSDCRYPRNY